MPGNLFQTEHIREALESSGRDPERLWVPRSPAFPKDDCAVGLLPSAIDDGREESALVGGGVLIGFFLIIAAAIGWMEELPSPEPEAPHFIVVTPFVPPPAAHVPPPDVPEPEPAPTNELSEPEFELEPDPEPVEPPEPVQQPEPVEPPEPVQQPEPVEPPEPVQQPEREPEPVGELAEVWPPGEVASAAYSTRPGEADDRTRVVQLAETGRRDSDVAVAAHATRSQAEPIPRVEALEEPGSNGGAEVVPTEQSSVAEPVTTGTNVIVALDEWRSACRARGYGSNCEDRYEDHASPACHHVLQRSDCSLVAWTVGGCACTRETEEEDD